MGQQANTSRSSRKKNAILAGAHHVFSTKGFLSVTMQDIIDECGISRGGIYLYFKSIDNLFFATITQRSVRQFDDIRAAIKANPPFKQLFNQYLFKQKERLLNQTQHHQSLLRAMYEYSFTHDTVRDRSLKQKQLNATRATVKSVLELGMKQQRVSQDVKCLADDFMLLIEGMNILALTGNLTEKQIDTQFAFFLTQLTAAPKHFS